MRAVCAQQFCFENNKIRHKNDKNNIIGIRVLEPEIQLVNKMKKARLNEICLQEIFALIFKVVQFAMR